MIKKVLVFCFVVVLSLCLGIAFSGTLLFDDFDGNELDESKWEIVNWKDNVDVSVENSMVTLRTVKNSRAGILTRESFNAGEGGEITVHVDGIESSADAQIDLNFGDWTEWSGEVVEFYRFLFPISSYFWTGFVYFEYVPAVPFAFTN